VFYRPNNDEEDADIGLLYSTLFCHSTTANKNKSSTSSCHEINCCIADAFDIASKYEKV